ncbi:hypothetical protein GZH46_00323 [Fragariocoptes setiger]|uniref:Cathepsin propeptide inhibitor domain-containing protein n=1 Tax=Fragariocoptes setiger TaxID=1670756 RepID=A0ABQ7SCH8_9ACAR|nr:hypothetical protein GZH46_00323 [Fragariocoptes setiger]
MSLPKSSKLAIGKPSIVLHSLIFVAIASLSLYPIISANFENGVVSSSDPQPRDYPRVKMEEFKSKYIVEISSEVKAKLGNVTVPDKISLPAWFNYDHYKAKFGKTYESEGENKVRHHIFVDNALQVLQQRAKYRAKKASYVTTVNHFADWTQEELKRMNGIRRSSKKGETEEALPTTDFTKPPDAYAKAVDNVHEILKSAEPDILSALIAELQNDKLDN